MKARFCDICGRRMYESDYRYKLYKGWFCTYSEYSRVDICVDCSREIKRLVEEKRKQEKTNDAI